MKTTLIACLLFAMPAFAQDDLPMPVDAVDGDPVLHERAELEQMLAPIALYPDSVLSNVLVAATYPLEVVQAARWSDANPGLEGEAAVEAVEEQDWDPSVKALVAFPELLARMDGDLDWMRRLGDAMLGQEDEVMAAVQSLRERAYAANTLDKVEHIVVRRVVHEERPAEQVIVIEPADPQIVYVPVYQPTVVYGGWHWPHHRPHIWHPPYHHHFNAGFWWGRGIRFSQASWFGAFDWHSHAIIVNVNRYKYRPRHAGVRRGFRPPEPTGVWRHNPRHRRGVPYASPRVDSRFGRMPVASPGELHPRPRPTVRHVRARIADAPQVRATPRVVPRTSARLARMPQVRSAAASRREPVKGRTIRVVDDPPRNPVVTRSGQVPRNEPVRSAPRLRPARQAPVVTPMPQVRRAPPLRAVDTPIVHRERGLRLSPARISPPRAVPRAAVRTPAAPRVATPAPAQVHAAPAPKPARSASKRTRGASDQER